MYSSRPPLPVPPRFDRPLPRYPSLVDESEVAITLAMPRRHGRIAPVSVRPTWLSRARLLAIACGAAAVVVLGAVLWLVAASSGFDRDAGADRQLAISSPSVTPGPPHHRVAAVQSDEPLPVVRAEDLPILPSNEQPVEAAPIARRRFR